MELEHEQHPLRLTRHKLAETWPESIRPIFSERELTFTFAICYRPSVCRLTSVTLVRPTQAVVIFGNSTAFGTLAIL